MIKVAFKLNSQQEPTGFRFEGHAGFAKVGKDIVCAAVSALAFTTVNSVEAFTSDRFVVESNEKKGYLFFELKDVPSKEAVLLLKSLRLGIEGILQEDAKKFITLVDWEV